MATMKKLELRPDGRGLVYYVDESTVSKLTNIADVIDVAMCARLKDNVELVTEYGNSELKTGDVVAITKKLGFNETTGEMYTDYRAAVIPNGEVTEELSKMLYHKK